MQNCRQPNSTLTPICLLIAAAIFSVALLTPAASSFAQRDKRASSAVEDEYGERRVQGLSLNDTEEILAIIRDVHPELGAQMDEVRDRNPELLKRQLRSHMRWVSGLHRLKQIDPVLYKLRVECLKLKQQEEDWADKLRAAHKDKKSDAAEKCRNELKRIIAAEIECKQKIREHELAKFQKRLNELKAQIESERKNKDKQITERLDELDPAAKK